MLCTRSLSTALREVGVNFIDTSWSGDGGRLGTVMGKLVSDRAYEHLTLYVWAPLSSPAPPPLTVMLRVLLDNVLSVITRLLAFATVRPTAVSYLLRPRDPRCLHFPPGVSGVHHSSSHTGDHPSTSSVPTEAVASPVVSMSSVGTEIASGIVRGILHGCSLCGLKRNNTCSGTPG